MTFKEFCKELLEEYKWASFQYDSVTQQQFHKIRLALTAVAKYQNVRVGFVLSSLVKVNKNVSSKLVSADIYAFFVSFT